MDIVEKTLQSLNNKHFEAYYCESSEEALKKALELIPENHLASWGGSKTCEDIGLIAALGSRNPVIDRDSAKTDEERMELMRKALLCDSFVTSANAISATGALINIDGNGNRVAAMTFGPKNVVVVAGINKLTPDEDSARERAVKIAARKNAARFAGHDGDKQMLESICCYYETIRLCRPAGKIKVILVGEELGF